jgi:hypothetical protein
MRRSALALAAVCALLFTSSVCLAGAWTQKEGEGYYKIGFQALYARNFYEPNGTRTPITPLGDYTVSVYGEYGFTGWLTGIAYLPFYKLNTLDRVVGRQSQTVYFDGDKASGFADLEVGVRIGLIRHSPTVLSAGVLFGLPIGDANQRNGLLSGDGEFNQLLMLEVGHSFHPLPLYATAQTGFNNRTRGFSDEFRYGAQAGYTFNRTLTLSLHLRGVESLKNGTSPTIGGTNGLYANNQSYTEYGGQVSYALSEVHGLSLGVSAPARGRNVISAPKYSLDIYFNW